MSTFMVRCRVSGGLTGTRESWLKSNGETMVFPDYDSAEAKATECRANHSGEYLGTRPRPRFAYWVVEVQS